MKVRGFTLIELLVVIAIIGILASIVLVSLNGAYAKARDAHRRADLETFQAALELYYNDNGSYPSTGGALYSSETGDVQSNNNGNWIPGLSPTYIATLPHSPGGPVLAGNCTTGGYKNAYEYRSDGVNYKLLAHCGPEGTWTSSDSEYDPVRPTTTWMVCSGEPACSTW